MAVPKKKTSQSRMKMRRSHISLQRYSYGICPNCGKSKLPHHICATCGFYNGRQVLADTRIKSEG